MNDLNQRSSRRARKQVNYADPKGNAKMRRGDAICANSLVQSFSPKTTGKSTGKKRTIKKSKKITFNFEYFHNLSHSILSLKTQIKNIT
jgi:hypothetical protein